MKTIAIAGLISTTFALTFSGALLAQAPIEATTSSGERVRLLPDGRWEFVDTQKAAVQREQRAVEAKKVEDVRQAELKRERGAQGGGIIGLGRTIYEGDKDYNRGSLNPKR
jgi:hypothetical protein